MIVPPPTRPIQRLAFFAAAIFLFYFSGAAQTPTRITAAVDDSARVTLPDSLHPLARAEWAGARLDPDLALDRMILLLDAGSEADAEMRALIDRLHQPGSPEFHHWLTPDEFGSRFGVAPQDIQTIRDWLTSQGFRIDSVAHGGRIILFSGTVRQVEAAFQTEMRHFQVRGEDHIANARPISIPSALAAAIKGVVTLDNFFSHPLIRPAARPNAITTTGANVLAPADFAAIYNLNPLYQNNLNGAGQRIALIERSDFNLSDYAGFRTSFGLPATAPNVIYTGQDPGFPVGTSLYAVDFQEATNDPEWAGAAAPGATIDVIISGSTLTSDGVYAGVAYAVEQNQDDVISLSFAVCEQVLSAGQRNAMFEFFAQAAAQGISAIVGAGDTGAADCDSDDPPNSLATHGLAVSAFASTPYDTAVGGSEFDESAAGGNSVFWETSNGPNDLTVRGYIPEMVWNESCNGTVAGSPCFGDGNLSAGPGGASVLYSKPSWQTLAITGIPQDGRRDLPDISLTASFDHDPRVMYIDGGVAYYGGTSYAAPSFAGIMAIIDQKLGGRQGLANYGLYSIAAAEDFSNCNSGSRTNPADPPNTVCPFNDITVGNNSIPGQTGFNAGLGYDLATGLGSVNASVLANAWSTFAGKLQPTTTTFTSTAGVQINITHGQPVTVNITVASESGPGIPTGTIALKTSTGLGFQEGVLGSNGSAGGTIQSLPGGTYTMFAVYSGDSNFAGSVSNSIVTTVSPENSAITLGIEPAAGFPNKFDIPPLPTSATLPFGTAVVVNVQLAGASGNVTFATRPITFSGYGPLVTEAVNSLGQTDLNWCFVTTTECGGVGTYEFTASYPGDASYNPSTSNTVTLTVTKVTPTITWNPGQMVAGVPLGTAQLNAAATYMAGLPAAATPVEGTFTYNPPAGTVLTAGQHTLTVAFTPTDAADFNPASMQVNVNVASVGTLGLAAAAGGVTTLAPGSLTSAFGSGLASETGSAPLPWPTTLDGTSVEIVDSAGASTAALMNFVSPGQVNFQIPDKVATRPATVKLTSGGASFSTQVNLVKLAPALFTLNSSNLTASVAICVSSSGGQTSENVYQVSNGVVVPLPLDLGQCSETILLLYGTGLDAATASDTQGTIGGVAATVQYAGPQGTFPGLDQMNVVIPASLAGRGNVPVVLTTNGMTANTVNLTIQ